MYILENQWKRRREKDELAVISLQVPPKKRGRPVILGKTLDNPVQEYILKLRERGCAVSTEIIRAAAKGPVQAMDITSLAENGGSATLSAAWAVIKYTLPKREVPPKAEQHQITWKKCKKFFVSEIVETVVMNDVIEDLIFN